MTTAADRQDEIIKEFSMLDGNLELTLQYLMELGQQLPAFPEGERTEENIVKGCQSKVWLVANLDDGKIYFQADSNTTITKGLVGLLLRVCQGLSPEEILKTEFFFPSKIGMDRFIGTQRSNGFASMIQQIRRYALAYSLIKEGNGQ
ncbi:MAG: SufE family protein [Bacteroidetes bacterium]|nr:SufE family protein [Bacteroidota bacterium]